MLVSAIETAGRIGPNAILQLNDPVERLLGAGSMTELLHCSDASMPSGQVMIDENEVARVHRALYRLHPDQAVQIARDAGAGTADYIIRNRIPAAARWLLHALPRSLGERMLTRAIMAHAWTFCGSGELKVSGSSPIVFELYRNPLLRGVRSDAPQCHWHAAVFEVLYSRLLGRPYRVRETACCATGSEACSFEVETL